MIFSGKAESKSIPLYWHSYIAYYTESRPVIVNIGVNVNAKTLSGIKEINELRIFFWQVFKHSWRLYIASCQHHARVAVREMRHLHGGTTTPYMVKRSVDGRQDRAFSVFLLKLCWVKNKKNGVWWVTAAGSKNYTTCFTPHKKNPLPPAVCAVTVTKCLLSRFCTEHSDFHWAFYPPGPCLSWQRGRWSKMPVSVTNTDSSCSRQIYTAVHTWAISTCWSFVTGKCTIASYINRIFVTSVCTHSICV